MDVATDRGQQDRGENNFFAQRSRLSLLPRRATAQAVLLPRIAVLPTPRYTCRMAPPFVPPMLARLVRSLPEDPDWEYELKLDGYRLRAIKDGEKVRLLSRRGNDSTRKFAKIATAVSKINPSAVASVKVEASSLILGGEAVVLDNQEKPSFQMPVPGRGKKQCEGLDPRIALL